MASKKKNNGLLLLLLLIPGILIAKNIIKKQKENKEPEPVKDKEAEPVNVEPKANDKFPLKKGSKGKNVVKLQNALLKYDKNILGRYSANGVFGPNTEAAVLKLLKKKEITEDDLGLLITQKSKNKKYITNKDIYFFGGKDEWPGTNEFHPPLKNKDIAKFYNSNKKLFLFSRLTLVLPAQILPVQNFDFTNGNIKIKNISEIGLINTRFSMSQILPRNNYQLYYINKGDFLRYIYKVKDNNVYFFDLNTSQQSGGKYEPLYPQVYLTLNN